MMNEVTYERFKRAEEHITRCEVELRRAEHSYYNEAKTSDEIWAARAVVDTARVALDLALADLDKM